MSFWVFEGNDGSGKSSAMEYAQEYLESKGYKVFVGFEPGTTELGKRLRMCLKELNLCAMQQTILLASARIQNHLEDGIIGEYLSAHADAMHGHGKYPVLLMDRYEASTYVYQGLLHRPNLEKLYLDLVSNHYHIERPDMYLMFNVSYEESVKRRAADTSELREEVDKLEDLLDTEDKFNNLQQEYRNFLVHNEKQRGTPFKVIDTTDNSIECTQEQVRSILDAYFTIKA